MATKQDRIDILEITIEELRGVHGWLSSAFRRMKDLVRTYLGAGLIALTFLYANGKTFIPKQTYGKIFYFIGLGLMIFAIATMIFALLPKHWEFSVEDKDLEDLDFDSKEDYLKYVKKRYMFANKVNLKMYENNHGLMNIAFFPLIVGAIILAVLKIFGT